MVGAVWGSGPWDRSGWRSYAGDTWLEETEEASVLEVAAEEASSSPKGFLPQHRVVSMQVRNCGRKAEALVTVVICKWWRYESYRNRSLTIIRWLGTLCRWQKNCICWIFISLPMLYIATLFYWDTDIIIDFSFTALSSGVWGSLKIHCMSHSEASIMVKTE